MGIIFLVIGYVIGILFTPRSGKENRKKIKDSVQDMVNEIRKD